uniref:Uncharacterized protein n=1 Tax=Hyaloperonospora arabidopsidis (strain Emoy2) TaxID=559515 RepID=M4BZW7_HYAAE
MIMLSVRTTGNFQLLFSSSAGLGRNNTMCLKRGHSKLPVNMNHLKVTCDLHADAIHYNISMGVICAHSERPEDIGDDILQRY